MYSWSKSLIAFLCPLFLPVAILCSQASVADAQSTVGTVDASFQSHLGTGIGVQAIVMLPNGYIFSAGGFSQAYALLDVNGGMVPTFAAEEVDAIPPFDYGHGIISSVGAQSSGSIILGGNFYQVAGVPSNYLARLNPDDSLDTTFSAAAGTDDSVLALAVQPDDRVVIGGGFTTVNGSSSNGIARLNADGSLDTSFTTGTGVDAGASSAVYCLALQPDGNILVGGSFVSINGVTYDGIARLMANGSLDPTFNPGSGIATSAGAAIFSLAPQSDGAVVVGGNFSQVNGVTRSCIARLTATGSVDATFDPGSGCNGVVNAVAVQADGRVLAGGAFSVVQGIARNGIVRFNGDGTIDPTFDPGSGANGVVTSVVFQGDGEILVGGYFTAFAGVGANTLVRLNSDGTVDATFQDSVQAGVSIFALAQQPDDQKLLAAGIFTQADNTATSSLVRLQTDGSLDPSFQLDPTLVSSTADSEDGPQSLGQAVLVLPNHEILVVLNSTSSDYLTPSFPEELLGLTLLTDDDFTGYMRRTHLEGLTGPVASGTTPKTESRRLPQVMSHITNPPSAGGLPRTSVILLQADGTIDSAFSSPDGIGFTIALALQSDGKFLAGGGFTSLTSATEMSSAYLARFNADGSPDATFVPGFPTSGTQPAISAISVQPADGKIIAAIGSLTQDAATEIWQVVRLNTDGSVDATYTAGTASGGEINTLALQSDGKILVGGSFQSFGSSMQPALTRLNADGTLDNDFIPGVLGAASGTTPVVTSFQVQADSEIIIAGVFETIGGVARNNVARLDADGTLDTEFDPVGLVSGAIRSLLLLSDGSILLGGDFSVVNGAVHVGVARLLNPSGLPPQLSLPSSLDAVSGQPFTYQLVASNLPTSYSATGLPSSLSIDNSTGLISGTPSLAGSYSVSLSATNASGTGTAILTLAVATNAVSANSSTHPAFFTGETALGNEVYYLVFPDGDYFGYYMYLAAPAYIYHFDLGYEYVFDAADGNSGVYLYDFASSDFFYTSPVFPFPYLYDFGLNAVLYYYPDTTNPGHYTTNPRYFFNFATGQIVTK